MSIRVSYKKEKLRSLLTTPEHADCTFIFEDERIEAHKLLLANCSPVFESMFYGKMAATEIKISDIIPGDFRKMLEYIYTDYVDVGTVKSAWSLVYISQKYFLNELLGICAEYIKLHLSLTHLLISYEFGQLYNHQELLKLCWQDISRYTKGILFTPDYHMKESTLVSILNEVDINATKSDLVLFSTKWAVEECTMNDKEITPENVWNVLSERDLLKYLNFNALDVSIFDSINDQHPDYDIINPIYKIAKELKNTYGKEIGNIIQDKTKPNVVNYKFRDIYRIAKNVIFTDILPVKSDISTSRTIYLFAIAVTTLHRPQKAATTSYMGKVRIKFVYDNYVFYNCLIEEQNLEYDHVQLINLPIPVRLEGGIFYTIIVIYESESLFERGEVILHYLSQCVLDKKSTSGVQFSGEIDGSVLQALSYYPA